MHADHGLRLAPADQRAHVDGHLERGPAAVDQPQLDRAAEDPAGLVDLPGRERRTVDRTRTDEAERPGQRNHEGNPDDARHVAEYGPGPGD